ncbi:MAG: T4 RnlA family RNA ligase [Bacillota bacterium]
MGKYNWNPVYNLFKKIKGDYISTFESLDTISFEDWLTKLNKKEYSDVFKCLRVNQFNEFILIRYGVLEMQEAMWSDPHSIYRECRSIVIDVVNEEIVLAPFRKFFNLNEVEENKLDNVIKKIQNAKSIEITDKLDGSMQSARYYRENIIMSGSMALDPTNSWRLNDGYKRLTEDHKRMITENPDCTFIFEYISLNDAHVVQYKKEQEGIYLIGVRNVFTGEQYSYNQIKLYADKYSVPMTKIEDKSFSEILYEVDKLKSYEKEGWVLNIDGHMIKLKCDDYVSLHKILNKLSSVNVIIQSIADDTYDDLLSKVPENFKGRVTSVAKAILEYVKATNEKINDYYIRAPKGDKKEFMIWITQNCPKGIQGYLRQRYLNKDWHVLKTCYGKSVKYKKIRELGIDMSEQNLFDDFEVV